MTKLDAMRLLLSKPREVDQGRIGKRVIYDTPDGRERIQMVFRILNFKRKAS